MIRARRLLMPTLLVFGGWLLCFASPALALLPEAPLTERAAITGPTTATLNGVLHPGNKQSAEEVEYHFAYNAGTGVTCTGAGSESAPVPAGKATGVVDVFTQVTGLQPSTQYTVCLVATNASGSTEGAPVTFTTPATTLVTRYPLLRFGESLGEPLPFPSGVAVDQANGNVFIVNENVVDVTGAAGGPPVDGLPARLTGEGTPAGSFAGSDETGVAVSDAGGHFSLYVADPRHDVVDRFTLNARDQYEYVCEFTGPGAPCVKRAGEATPTEAFFTPDAVAVDAQGNVYIASVGPEHGLVDKFNAVGEYVWGLSHTKHPLIYNPLGIAADTAGDVYLVVSGQGADAEADQTVKLEVGPDGAVDSEAVFDPAGKIEEISEGSGRFIASQISTGVAVDQSTGDVLVYHVTPNVEPGDKFYRNYVQERNPSGGLLSEFNVAALAGGTFQEYSKLGSAKLLHAGIAVREDEAANDVYVVSEEFSPVTENPTDEELEVFGPLPPTVKVSTRTASEAEGSSATLNGTVNPKGVPLTECEFEYGTTSSYGQSLECEPKPTEIGAGETPSPVSAKLTGLLPNEVYHYQLVAKSENGFSGKGGDGTVTIPVRPAVNDLPPAAAVTRTTVQLAGTADPENSPTSYHFVYVDEAEYELGAANPYAAGSETPTLAAGDALADEALAPQAVTGLTADTTYHYALVASNAAGASVGEDHTFTTAAGTPPLVSTGAASEVTQTTATIAGVVDPQGIQTSYEFDLGTDTSYGGARVFANAGQSARAEAVTLALGDLIPGTTYHYRIAATNEDGTSYGADQSFTTPGVPSPIVQPLSEPLIAAPLIAFPTEAGTVVKAPAKKKVKAKDKKKKKTRKKVKKTNRRGK